MRTAITTLAAAAIALGLAGCDEAKSLSSVKSEMAGEPGARPEKNPTPGPPQEFAGTGSQCPFEESQRLTAQLAGQFAESARLEGEIRKNLEGLGYGF